MAIDINGLGAGHQVQVNNENSQVSVARSEPTAAQEETGGSSTGDTVSLTDTAAQLQKLENTLAALPVADTARVESIKQALNEGTFNVDNRVTAEKMLGMETALNNVS